MNKIFLFLIGICSLQSCAPATVLVNENDLKRVPRGATKVISLADAPADETFSTVAKVFAKSGCPVKTDKESMQIVCDGMSVEGGTMLRALAYVEPTKNGTLVTMSGEWGLNATGQVGMVAFAGANGISGTNKIRWEGLKNTKPCIAFQHLILMSIAIPDSKQRYE